MQIVIHDIKCDTFLSNKEYNKNRASIQQCKLEKASYKIFMTFICKDKWIWHLSHAIFRATYKLYKYGIEYKTRL